MLELSILTIFACRDSSIIKCGSLQDLCFGEIKAHHRSLHLLVWKGRVPQIVEAFSSYALLLVSENAEMGFGLVCIDGASEGKPACQALVVYLQNEKRTNPLPFPGSEVTVESNKLEVSGN